MGDAQRLLNMEAGLGKSGPWSWGVTRERAGEGREEKVFPAGIGRVTRFHWSPHGLAG